MQRSIALIAFVALGLMSSTSQGQSRGGGGDSGRGGGGGQDAAAAGGGGVVGGEMAGTAGGVGDLLIDPTSVFGLERGATAGATADTVTSMRPGLTGPGAAAGGGAARGGMGGGAMGGMGGLGGLSGLFGGLNQFGAGAGTEQQKAIRTRLRSAVQVAPVPPQQVQARIQQQLYSMPSSPRFQGTQVRMDGRTAVLSGQVQSAEDRRMAELLMRLEPGVSRIENNLSVAPPIEVPAPPADPVFLPQP